MKNRASLILLIIALLAFTTTEVAFLAWYALDREDAGIVEISADQAEDEELADAEDDIDPDEDPIEEAKEMARENPDAEFEGYIVTLSEDAGSETIDRIDEAIADGAGIRKLEYTENTYVCEDPEKFRDLTEPGEIESAEPDFKLYMLEGVSEMTAAPNDPYYDKQYNIDAMNVGAVWEKGLEGQDVDDNVDADGNGTFDDDDMIVAVIDSGLYAEHEDFDQSRIVDGWNFYDDSNDTSALDGHGTLIAGIIASKKNNGKGTVGLLQSVKIMPVRVFGKKEGDESANTTYSIVADALNYLVTRKNAGVNIVAANLSLGGPGVGNDTVLRNACNAAMDAGIIVVCAAGNERDTVGNHDVYPAQFTMGVGALTTEGEVAGYSQMLSDSDGDGWERKVWVTAPGDSLYGPSIKPLVKYTKDKGTSYACPEVTALAALCKSIDNDMTQADFMDLLRETATPAGTYQNDAGERIQDAGFGWGRVNFDATVEELLTEKSTVTFKVTNVLGSEISGAGVTITEKNSGSEITKGEDGTWLLKEGTEYDYEVTADGYADVTGSFTPELSTMTVRVTLEGNHPYQVTVSVKDKDGNDVEESEYSYALYSLPDEEEVAGNGDGTYSLKTGKYRIRITSDHYLISAGRDFDIDDIKEDLSGGRKTVDLVLRKDITGLRWTNGGGSTSEAITSLAEIKSTGQVRPHTLSGNDSDLEVEGITVTDLFENIMSLNEDIVSVQVEGKKLVSVEDDGSDEDRYVLEDDTVTIEGKFIKDAVIAVEDPSGYDDLMAEGNLMRLVIGGREESEWLYAPSGISITTKRNLQDCTIEGLSNSTYTGSAVTKQVEVFLGTEMLEEGVDYTLSYKNNIDAGLASVTVTGKGGCTGSKTGTFRINKAPASLRIITSTASVKKSKLKKKAQKVSLNKVMTLSGGYGPVTYVKAGGSKKLSINRTSGKITVKKKTKKGKYKLRVRVNAAGDRNHEAAEKTVTVTIRVK